MDIWGYKKISIRLEQSHPNQLIFITGNISALGQFGKLEKMKLITRATHMNSTSPERFIDKNLNPFQDNEIASLINSAELKRKSISKQKETSLYEVTRNILRQKEICQKFFEAKDQNPKNQENIIDLSPFSIEKKIILEKRLSFDVSYLINGDSSPCSPIRTSFPIDGKNKSNSSPSGRNSNIQNEENTYWEKNFLIPNNHTEPLQYNFYALDLKTNTIFSHDQEFEANLNEDITLLSHLWSPQNSSPIMETKKLIIFSPLKIRKEGGSEMKVELGYKTPNRFERKQNLLILYNDVSFISDYREITSEICIGKKKNNNNFG